MQSSKNSLERYYSVASAFNCDHFKSMDNTGVSDCFSVTTPAIYQSDCSCSTVAVGTGTISQSGASKLGINEEVDCKIDDHCKSEDDVKLYTLTGSNSAGQLLTTTVSNKSVF